MDVSDRRMQVQLTRELPCPFPNVRTQQEGSFLPEQDVASTSRIDIVIKNVASPVIRHINIKIGFAKTV